jgi:hypothetical protein
VIAVTAPDRVTAYRREIRCLSRKFLNMEENMKEDTNTKSAEPQPNDSQDEELTPKELGEISGGLKKRSGDPCEGGE